MVTGQRLCTPALAFLALFAATGSPAQAQPQSGLLVPGRATAARQLAPAGAGAAQPAVPPQDVDEDEAIDPLQPDFTLAALPTTLRLPRHKFAFRVTHRFTRPLGQGDFGDLVADFFGIDAGALIGLELRFGLTAGLQAGVHRTSDRTIQFFGQGSVLRQGEASPVALDVLAAVEGTNNFKDEFSGTIGLALSRTLSRHAAVYVEPLFVGHSDVFNRSTDDSTFMVGLGARLRLSRTASIVGEWVPRLAGYDLGVDHGSVGIEKRVGGHLFQLNVSNAFGTTLGQMARGGIRNDDWYLGFNISRKFY